VYNIKYEELQQGKLPLPDVPAALQPGPGCEILPIAARMT